MMDRPLDYYSFLICTMAFCLSENYMQCLWITVSLDLGLALNAWSLLKKLLPRRMSMCMGTRPNKTTVSFQERE